MGGTTKPPKRETAPALRVWTKRSTLDAPVSADCFASIIYLVLLLRSPKHYVCRQSKCGCAHTVPGYGKLAIGPLSLALYIYDFLFPSTQRGKGPSMQEHQRVSDMVLEVLTRQASTLSKHTEEPSEEALEAVLETEAGRQLRELSEGPYRHESAQQWQAELPRKRAKERRQTRQEERRRAHQEER